MNEHVYLSFVFFVTAMSLLIFPASNLTGISYLFIGWLAWVFLIFFGIGLILILFKGFEVITKKGIWQKQK